MRVAAKAKQANRWSELAKAPGAILPRPRERKTKPRPKVSEAQMQDMVEQYLDYRHLFYIRIPDALFRVVMASERVSVGDKRVIADYLKGLPDLTILHGGRYLALELKREDGRLSDAQRSIRGAIGTQVARSVDEAIETINTWIGGDETHGQGH